MKRCCFFTVLMMLLSISYFTPRASGFLSVEDSFPFVPCEYDDNNLHINASKLEEYTLKYDSVCDDDLYDWYHFPGWGDVDFNGYISIYSDGPGLDIRLYFDSGGGIIDVLQDTVEYREDNGLYMFVVSIEDECLNAGFPPPLQGDLWLRISVLAGYSGVHPYGMRFYYTPRPGTAGGTNSSANATELPIGENRCGTLTQTDFYHWYTWDQPVGEPADGIIELSMVHKIGLDDIPPMQLVLFGPGGPELASATLGGEDWYAYIDLEALGIGPGTYTLDVLLTHAVTEPVTYQVRNRATMGTSEGCGADSNEDPSNPVPIYDEAMISDSLCHPRDHIDYYRYSSDNYFIGDITLQPLIMDNFIQIEVMKVNESLNSSSDMCNYTTFYKDPIPPGVCDIFILDWFSDPEVQPYQITVIPDGAGPYRAPGHATWQEAEDMLGTFSSYSGFYSFELEAGQQDSYFFKATAPYDWYLIGILDVIGSQPDYEVRIGVLGPTGPAWGPPYTPNATGRKVFDFGYEVLTDPADYILRIKLDPSVTGRRRFFVDQTFSISDCLVEVPDSFNDPAGGVMRIGDRFRIGGGLCPPDDMVDFAEITIGPDANWAEIPSNYRMVAKVGFPLMGFKLIDAGHNIIWAKQLGDIGDSITVNLDGLVVEGETYVLEVTTERTDERLMLWEVEFLPPITGIARGAISDMLIQRGDLMRVRFD